MIHTDGVATIANAETALRDFRVRNEGSLFLVTPLTAAGRDWIIDNVDDDEAQRFGGSLVVEHGYIVNLVDGIFDSGLTIQ